MSERTFLDVVRLVGELTRDRCDSECSLKVHRREASLYIGMLIERSDLLDEVVEIARRRAAG